MIPVKFTLDPGTNPNEWLEYARYMPWLDYLITHAHATDIDSVSDQARYMIIVTYKFHLDPNRETLYRLKYDNY